jgi:hypothetical protein
MSSPELPNRALQRPPSFLASLGRLLAAERQIADMERPLEFKSALVGRCLLPSC